MEHWRVDSAGVGLHVAAQGEGAAVVLLHGFPETWESWRRVAEPLARAGLRVIMPDLRGYGDSDAPRRVVEYAADRLVSDVEAVVQACGGRAHIVGHDWGGVMAWWFAAAHPELLDRLVIVNAPHPAILRRHLRRWEQLRRLWYAGLFQLPWLPERMLRAHDFAAIRRILHATPARRGAFEDALIEKYIAALRKPGRLSGALNYYRAGLRHGSRAPRPVRTSADTLVVWGERDAALTVELLDEVPKYAPHARIVRLPDVGHWVQNEAPDELAALLIEWLAPR